MKRISVNIGYRAEGKLPTVYFPGKSDEGYCYKDRYAFENEPESICFIRERIFDDFSGNVGVTAEKLSDIDDIYTKKQMTEWTEDYVKDAPKPFRDTGFIEHIVECIFDELDWCGFDVYLDELDMDEEMIDYAVGLLDKMNVPRDSYDKECMLDFLCNSGKGLEDSLDEFVDMKPI